MKKEIKFNDYIVVVEQKNENEFETFTKDGYPSFFHIKEAQQAANQIGNLFGIKGEIILNGSPFLVGETPVDDSYLRKADNSSNNVLISELLTFLQNANKGDSK